MSEETQSKSLSGGGAAARTSPARAQAKTSVVLVCPNEEQRRSLNRALEAQSAVVLKELNIYPTYNHLLKVIESECDAFVVEADTDCDAALLLVEAICSRKPESTVMIFSASQNPDLLVGAMRAGAREFLTGAVTATALSEALQRASLRRSEHSAKRADGKVFVFWGAKGGCGVTTLAANFAIALRKETGEEVALLDLHPQLGDASVLLGLTPRFTLAEALQSPHRLDGDFVASLASEHRSGVSVFAAPDVYSPAFHVEARTIAKLLELVRSQYPYLVIDAGLGLGESAEALFRMAHTVYLVAQADIPSVRNSQRILTYLQDLGEVRTEFVLNRFEARRSEFDDDRLSQALGKAPQWKVPNDFVSVRRASDAGTPVQFEKSPVARVVQQMARAACGKPQDSEKKRGFGLFG